MGKSQRLVRKFEMVSTIGFTSCVMGYVRHTVISRYSGNNIIAGDIDLPFLQYLGGSFSHQRGLSEKWRTCWAFLVYGLGHLRAILRELPLLCFTGAIVQLLLGIHDFYHLKPKSLLIHYR